jgi:hypothetical protein
MVDPSVDRRKWDRVHQFERRGKHHRPSTEENAGEKRAKEDLH